MPSLIWAVITSIKPLKDLFFGILELYFKELDHRDDNTVSINAKKRDALLASLRSKEVTDEQKNYIRRMLFDLSRN